MFLINSLIFLLTSGRRTSFQVITLHTTIWPISLILLYSTILL